MGLNWHMEHKGLFYDDDGEIIISANEIIQIMPWHVAKACLQTPSAVWVKFNKYWTPPPPFSPSKYRWALWVHDNSFKIYILQDNARQNHIILYIVAVGQVHDFIKYYIIKCKPNFKIT